jgi:hypothetical protein
VHDDVAEFGGTDQPVGEYRLQDSGLAELAELVKGSAKKMYANRTENESALLAAQAEALHHPV